MVLRNEKWAFKGKPSWFTESTIKGKGAKKIYSIEPNTKLLERTTDGTSVDNSHVLTCAKLGT